MRTRLTTEYGLEVPIVAAGMAFRSTAPLVAAVSNAGGLGVLGTGPISPDALRAQIREVRDLSARPFGVEDVAGLLSEALGARIDARPVDGDAVRAQMHAAGAPAWLVDSLVALYALLEDGLQEPVTALPAGMADARRTMRQFVHEHRSEFAGS